MERGKRKCEMLRSIRKEIAERHGLHYEPSECHHEGDCPGTCPACDSELHELQRQLDAKGIDKILASSEQVEAIEEGYSKEPDLPAGIPASPDYMIEGEDSPIDELEGIETIPPKMLKPLQGEPISPEWIKEQESEKVILDTYVAGIKFHDALEVWQDLYEGADLLLVRDKDNHYDENAVAVVFVGEDEDGVTQEYTLGYIPREENETIAAIIDMGWSELLRCEIEDVDESGKNPSINITVCLKNKSEVDITTDDKGLRYLVLDPDDVKTFDEQMPRKGYCHYRWMVVPTWECDVPKEGEKVLFIHYNDENTVELCLMLVIAVSDNAAPFLDDGEELRMVDDHDWFVLSCIGRGVILPTDDVFEEYDICMDYCQPELRLTVEKSEKIMRLFNRE